MNPHRMDLPAQEAGGKGEYQDEQRFERLQIVGVECRIGVDSLDGERTDRPLRRRLILSPPPFEGMQRKSLRRESLMILGEFSSNYENSSGKKQLRPERGHGYVLLGGHRRLWLEGLPGDEAVIAAFEEVFEMRRLS